MLVSLFISLLALNLLNYMRLCSVKPLDPIIWVRGEYTGREKGGYAKDKMRFAVIGGDRCGYKLLIAAEFAAIMLVSECQCFCFLSYFLSS